MASKSKLRFDLNIWAFLNVYELLRLCRYEHDTLSEILTVSIQFMIIPTSIHDCITLYRKCKSYFIKFQHLILLCGIDKLKLAAVYLYKIGNSSNADTDQLICIKMQTK